MRTCRSFRCLELYSFIVTGPDEVADQSETLLQDRIAHISSLASRHAVEDGQAHLNGVPLDLQLHALYD